MQTIDWLHLVDRLSSVARRTCDVVVGHSQGATRRFISCDGSSGHVCESDGTEFIGVGCAIKLFTASVMDLLVRGGYVHWHDAVSNFIAPSPALEARTRRSLPADLTIRHLLNHTHGLDDSLLSAPPALEDGWIDAAGLCDHLLSFEPLSKPGAFCSYGDAGAWLAGAVLERVTNKTYGTLVAERLFAPLGFVTSGSEGQTTSLCPSVEPELKIRCRDMLSFLEAHFAGDEHRASASELVFDSSMLMGDPTPLPGWSPLERGVCVGWKFFGSGWFGHNSLFPGYSTVVRVNPSTQTAIVLSGASESAFTLFAKAFGSFYPELAAGRLPKMLRESQLATLPLDGYIGEYANGALRVAVTSSEGRLRYQAIENRAEPGLVHATSQPLLAAKDNVFFPFGARLPSLPLLQFVRGTLDETFQYIWNGQNLLRRRR